MTLDPLENEYIVFTDESNITDSRFQSLSAFSFKRKYYSEIVPSIQAILIESGVSEFKWQKVKDAKYSFCAEKFIHLILDNIGSYNLRVDTIVWDTHDSRHSIPGRDDYANYERMLFHLLNNSMKKRPKGSSWIIHPDVRGGVDWNTLHDCLRNVGKRQELDNTLFGNFISDPYYSVHTFEERESHKEVPIQVADLFSGLTVFSRDSFDCYKSYKASEVPSLFGEPEIRKLTNRESTRCKLLDMLNQECKKRSLGVSLETNGYLHTYKPENPINFWHYMPQGNYDKAPLRSERGLNS